MNDPDLLRVACPDCGKALRVKAALAGRRIRCPNKACDASIVVPSGEREEGVRAEGHRAGSAKPRRAERSRDAPDEDERDREDKRGPDRRQEDSDDRPRRDGRKGRARRKSGGMLFWLIGGLVAAGAAAVVIVLVLNNSGGGGGAGGDGKGKALAKLDRGTNWSTLTRYAVDGFMDVSAGDRFYIWPADDRVHTTNPAGGRRQSVVIRYHWQLLPGKSLPPDGNVICTLTLVAGGSRMVSSSTLKLDPGATEGTFQLDHGFEEHYRGEGDVHVWLSPHANLGDPGVRPVHTPESNILRLRLRFTAF